MSLDDKLDDVPSVKKEHVLPREDIRRKLEELLARYEELPRLASHLRTMDLPADPKARQELIALLTKLLHASNAASTGLVLYTHFVEELYKAGPLALHGFFRSITYGGLNAAELRHCGLPAAKLASCEIAFEHAFRKYTARYDAGGTLWLAHAGALDESGLQFIASCIDQHHGGQPCVRITTPGTVTLSKPLGRGIDPAGIAAAAEQLYCIFSFATIAAVRYANISRQEFLDAKLPAEKVTDYQVG
jgi:hypothetical protein